VINFAVGRQCVVVGDSQHIDIGVDGASDESVGAKFAVGGGGVAV